MNNKNWWKGAVIYQIYPSSFADGNNDGIGDFKGIASKMDYIKSLGVDAVWTSPICKSPMKDFGYDVSDYCDTNERFGTLDEFDQMLKEAHDRGLKFFIDFVPSHTSDQHAWFTESRSSKTNPKADWYVWADPKPDGTAPNNWLSVFGGSAWQWDSTRCQYYMHNFLKEQPDINWQNPEAVEAVLGEMEFWLKRGVDGFRYDVIAHCMHDTELRDNPAIDVSNRANDAKFGKNPFFYQHHYYNIVWPQMIDNLKKIRALLDKYDAACVGEVATDHSLDTLAIYTKGQDKIHMGYTFNLLDATPTPLHIRTVVQDLESKVEDGWACWSLSNHDVLRLRSRFGGLATPDDVVKVLNAILLSIRGSVCVYQGDELGLPEADVPFERLQDPYGIEFWPEFKGRDGCRTPMPWNSSKPNNGFSKTEPWLPAVKEHTALSVDIQDKDKNSILNSFRSFTSWRKLHKALIKGSISFIEADEEIMSFYREYEDEKLICFFNISANKRDFNYNNPFGEDKFVSGGYKQANNKLTLDPYSFVISKI